MQVCCSYTFLFIVLIALEQLHFSVIFLPIYHLSLYALFHVLHKMKHEGKYLSTCIISLPKLLNGFRLNLVLAEGIYIKRFRRV
jgi:hypothetical protein